MPDSASMESEFLGIGRGGLLIFVLNLTKNESGSSDDLKRRFHTTSWFCLKSEDGLSGSKKHSE